MDLKFVFSFNICIFLFPVFISSFFPTKVSIWSYIVYYIYYIIRYSVWYTAQALRLQKKIIILISSSIVCVRDLMNHLHVEIHSNQRRGIITEHPNNCVHWQLRTQTAQCMTFFCTHPLFFPRALVFNRSGVQCCLLPQGIVHSILRYFGLPQYGGANVI